MRIMSKAKRTGMTVRQAAIASALAFCVAFTPAAFGQQQAFPSPEAAMDAFGDAVARSDDDKMRALLGQSPGRLIRTVRLRRAADLIEARAHNLSTIAYKVGFSDQSHFSRAFKQLYGVSPSAYGERVEADRGSSA